MQNRFSPIIRNILSFYCVIGSGAHAIKKIEKDIFYPGHSLQDITEQLDTSQLPYQEISKCLSLNPKGQPGQDIVVGTCI